MFGASVIGSGTGVIPEVVKKSPLFGPENLSAAISTVAVEDVLLRKICLLVPGSPIAAGPSEKLVAENESPAVVPRIDPERGIVCGLPTALSVSTNVAVRVPVAEAAGVNVISTLQNVAGVSELQDGPYGLKTAWNSLALGPVTDAFVIARLISPLFSTCKELG